MRIVPAASAHKIDKLMEAVDNHIQRNLYGPGNPTQEFSYPSSSSFGHNDEINDKEDKNKDDKDKNSDKQGSGKLRRALEKWTGVMIEYILIDEINTLDAHAHELGALLSANQDRREHIILNLIPYNPTDVAEDFHPPSMENVDRFAGICMSEPYRLRTKIRREMGQDIAGMGISLPCTYVPCITYLFTYVPCLVYSYSLTYACLCPLT